MIRPLALALLASSALRPSAALAQDAAPQLPSGGNVVSGAASIGAAKNGAMRITQASDRAIVDWRAFSVGEGGRLVFDQPGRSSAILNRVTGSTTSTIAGQISANGIVYLVNPNGIAIASTGTVRTGGGFVASTLDIADSDFTAGRLAFTGGGASRRVANKGRIEVGEGGYAALLGGSVLNAGEIVVPLGWVGLASGESIALDINGDGFMQVAAPTAAITGGDTALIEMTGAIAAAGGRVVLTTASVRDAVRNVVNMSGDINADSAIGDGGSIVLFGGDGGRTRVSGTLSARATGAAGDGGFVDTSGADVDYAGLKVDTSAAHGKTGTWLIDPYDLTVDATAAATISSNLATNNVTLKAFPNTASGPGIQNPDGNGDIFINSAISWSSANTLTLIAYRNTTISAPITATNAAGQLYLDTYYTYGSRAATATAPVNVGIFTLAGGNWTQNVATLPAFSARDFRIDPVFANFLRTTGGAGTAASPYRIVDAYGLQGIASRSMLANSFTLASDIDASGTAAWNGGAGFIPIGYRTQSNFSGTFSGGYHAISGLTIALPTGSNVGLFSRLFNASISNLSLIDAAITGGEMTGALAGYVDAPPTISNVFSSGSVTGTGSVGGLIGRFFGTGSRLYSAAAVRGSDAYVGGLIGVHGGTLDTAWAQGSVSDAVAGADSAAIAGGLVGIVNGYDNVRASLINAYATGTVQTAGQGAGGLAGAASQADLRNVYATGDVRGGNYTGGLLGEADPSTNITGAYATGAVTGGDVVGGFAGGSYGASLSGTYATGAVTATGAITGGFIGEFDGSSSVSSSYFDSYSTGRNNAFGTGASSGASIVTSDPGQAGAANYAYKAGAYGMLPTASGIGSASVSGFAFVPGDQTRPFLAFEVPTNYGTVSNAHQLQLIGYDGTTRANTYYMYGDIDLAETGRVRAGTPSSYSGMWASGGFSPIGLDYDRSYRGTFVGNAFTISNLTINRPDSDEQGLFGHAEGRASISAVTMANANVVGRDTTGALVGYFNGLTLRIASTSGQVAGRYNVGGLAGLIQSGTVQTAASSATVSGVGGVGGLIGQSLTSIVDSSATGAVTGTGANGYIGGLVGLLNSRVSNSFATGTVRAAGPYAGGLAGYVNNGKVASSYASGDVRSGSTAANSYVGGLIGYIGNDNGGVTTAVAVANSYASGAVSSAGGAVGGLIGYFNSSGATLANAYATGAAQGTSNVGGLVGFAATGTRTSSVYSSGAVSTTSGSPLIGALFGTGNGDVANAYYDTFSTGKGYAFGSSSTGAAVSNILQVTSNPAQAGASNYAYKAGAYARLAAGAGIGSGDAAGFVFLPGDSTRPFLAFEVPVSGNPGMVGDAKGQLLINSAHQLQLVGYNAATLAGKYALNADISLKETGRNTGAAATSGGMWSQAGWQPIGADAAGALWNGSAFASVGYADVGRTGLATGFSGVLDGAGHRLTDLTIRRGGVQNVGLFGGSSGTIRDLTVTGSVLGYVSAGGLVGLMQGGAISGVTSSVTVTGSSGSAYIGGLVGFASNATIANARATGAVSASGAAGGLVGLLADRSVVTDSSASGAVNGRVGKSGGLVGIVENSTVTGGASTGSVNGIAGLGYGVLRDGGGYNGVASQ